jgi:hypothetical protein
MTERRKPIPKTQKEISNDQINPYDKTIGNPNDAAKINDPKARKSFAARHKCSMKKDKTKAGYWACRLPRYKNLVTTSISGYW